MDSDGISGSNDLNGRTLSDILERGIATLAETAVVDDGFVNEAFEAEAEEEEENEIILEKEDVRRRLDFGPMDDRSPRFVRRNACRRMIRNRVKSPSRRKFEFRATCGTLCTSMPSGESSSKIDPRDHGSTNHDDCDIPHHFSCVSAEAEDVISCASPLKEFRSSSKVSASASASFLCDDRTEIGRNSDLSVISRVSSENGGLCSRCAPSPTDNEELACAGGWLNRALAVQQEWTTAIPERGVANHDQHTGRQQWMQDDRADMTNVNVHASGVGGGGGGGGSSGPPNLLPRRHAGGGAQPPPLPPARHRGNVGGVAPAAGGNCCCCGGGIAPPQPQAQPPDRRAVASGSDQCPTRATTGDFRNGHRRERRQKQGMSADMSSPPSGSSSAASPPGLVSSPSPPPPIPPHGPEVNSQPGGNHGTEVLPDILNSHLPPPYSTLPHTTEQSSRLHAAVPPTPPPRSPPQCALPVSPTVVVTTTTTTVAGPNSPSAPAPPRRSARAVERFSSLASRPSNARHRSNRPPRSTPRGTHYTPEDEPKNCCGVAVTQTVSIRWFIVMIAFVGLCCAVVGTVLGALKATGREHLTVSLLMIGVGIVLITVSGIAWRLTSHDAPSCRMMLGLHSEEPEPNRRFVPRVPPSYGRPHHPYAAMMYPEFQYRPPPPSYQASMQEYRLRLLLLDRHQPAPSTSHSPVSPPPTYRSNVGTNGDTFARPPITFARESDYSRPPSYRSRASSVNPNPGTTREAVCHLAGGPNTVTGGYVASGPNVGTMDRTTAATSVSIHHSRDPSLSLSLLSHESLFDMAAPSIRGNNNNNNIDRTNNVLVSTSKVRTPPDVTAGRCPIVTNVSTNSASALRSLEPASDSRNLKTTRSSVENNRFSVHSDVESGDLHRRDCNADVDVNVANATSRTIKRPHDCNVVTIVQTTNSSRVLAHDGQEQGLTSSVGVQVPPTPLPPPGELEVLAHL